MTCADFLAGANLDSRNPEMFVYSISHFFKFLPGQQKQSFLERSFMTKPHKLDSTEAPTSASGHEGVRTTLPAGVSESLMIAKNKRALCLIAARLKTTRSSELRSSKFSSSDRAKSFSVRARELRAESGALNRPWRTGRFPQVPISQTAIHTRLNYSVCQ